MSDLPAWTRWTGRGSEIEAIGPEQCPNGHQLRPPNVLIRSNVEKISYECRLCGVVTHRHGDGSETFQQDVPF